MGSEMCIRDREIAGLTVNFAATYDPNADEESSNASSGGITTSVSGDAYVLEVSAMGLKVGLGQENINNGAGLVAGTDEENTTGYVTYSNGPISIGYQEAYANNRHAAATEGADNESEFWGIKYSADGIALSYAESEYMTHAVSNDAAGLTQELEAIQASYTMGSMTIMASLSEGSNIGAAADKTYEETSIAVNFAF